MRRRDRGQRRIQSPRQRQASIKNFNIFRLKGMLVTLDQISVKSTRTAPYGAAKLAIKEIIRSLKHV